jgi:hypothetical protein
VREIIPPIRSAVDLGCGVGTWLSVLEQDGVQDVHGVDGPWVDTGLLQIPGERFRVADLEERVAFDRKYDIAISLEVAEHLSPESAPTFVDSLTSASDFILFSGAIPFQGGSRHVNEQWPEYWAALFHMKGYDVVDCIRSRIWTDERIPTWYRQNTFLYVSRDRLGDIDISRAGAPFPALSVVNPDAFVDKVSTVKVSWRTFRKAVGRWIMRRNGVASVRRPTGSAIFGRS